MQTAEPTKEQAKESIKLLVDKYRRLLEAGKVKTYNEEMTKKDLILPLFRALGWNVEDGEEVTAEEKISKGRVDEVCRESCHSSSLGERPVI